MAVCEPAAAAQFTGWSGFRVRIRDARAQRTRLLERIDAGLVAHHLPHACHAIGIELRGVLVDFELHELMLAMIERVGELLDAVVDEAAFASAQVRVDAQRRALHAHALEVAAAVMAARLVVERHVRVRYRGRAEERDEYDIADMANGPAQRFHCRVPPVRNVFLVPSRRCESFAA